MPAKVRSIRLVVDGGADRYLFARQDLALRKVHSLMRNGISFAIYDFGTDERISVEEFLREAESLRDQT